jgi:hypothetical protein
VSACTPVPTHPACDLMESRTGTRAALAAAASARVSAATWRTAVSVRLLQQCVGAGRDLVHCRSGLFCHFLLRGMGAGLRSRAERQGVHKGGGASAGTGFGVGRPLPRAALARPPPAPIALLPLPLPLPPPGGVGVRVLHPRSVGPQQPHRHLAGGR